MIYSVASPRYTSYLATAAEITTVLSQEEHATARCQGGNPFYAEWFGSESVRMTVQQEYLETVRPEILGTWGAGPCAIVVAQVGRNLLLGHVDAGSEPRHLAQWLRTHGAKEDLSNATVVLTGTEAVRELRTADFPKFYEESDAGLRAMNYEVPARPEVVTTGYANRKWSCFAKYVLQDAKVHFVEWGITEPRHVRVQQGSADVPVVSAYARIHPETGRLHVLVTRGFWLWEQRTPFQAKLCMAWMQAGGTAWPKDKSVELPEKIYAD